MLITNMQSPLVFNTICHWRHIQRLLVQVEQRSWKKKKKERKKHNSSACFGFKILPISSILLKSGDLWNKKTKKLSHSVIIKCGSELGYLHLKLPSKRDCRWAPLWGLFLQEGDSPIRPWFDPRRLFCLLYALWWHGKECLGAFSSLWVTTFLQSYSFQPPCHPCKFGRPLAVFMFNFLRLFSS